MYSPEIIIEKVQGSPEFANIISDSKIKYVDKVDQHEVISKSQKSLSAGMQLLIKMTTTMAIAFATPAAGFFNLAGTQAAMVNVGFSTLCGNAAVSLVENDGNPAKAMAALEKNGLGKNIARSVATAGLFGGGGTLPGNAVFMDYLKKVVIQSTVNTAIAVAVDKQDFKQAMLQGMTSAAINTVASWGAGQIGDAYKINTINPVVHKLLHTALGGASGAAVAAILGGDVKLAALSGATGALIAENVADMLKPDAKSEAIAAVGKKMSRDEFEEKFMAKVRTSANWGNFAAALGSFAAGLDVGVAYGAAHNATENNTLRPLTAVLALELFETYQVVYAIAAAGGLKALLDTINVKSLADGSYSLNGKKYQTLPEILEIVAAAPIAQTKIIVATIQKMLMDIDPNAGKPTVIKTPIHEPKPLEMKTPIAEPQAPLPGFEIDPNAGKGMFEGFATYDGPQINILNKDGGGQPKVKKEVRIADGDGSQVDITDKKHVLYGKPGPNGVPDYIGRTSGEASSPADIQKILEQRDRNHHMNAKGFLPARPITVSEDPAIIRGLEQLHIDKLGGAQSMGGSSSNAINSIGKNNPKREDYLQAAKKVSEES